MATEKSPITQFEQIFARELTPELASNYVDSLLDVLGGPNQPFEEIVQKGNRLHEHVGENIYGPLIAGYVNWVEKKCSEIGHTGPVFFALRDAAPLETAAKVLWNGKTIYPVGVYANRPMLMIEDEIAPEWTNANGKVVEYLGMLGLSRVNQVVWSDTGAWGTVVKALKVGLLSNADFHPLFWYSHNPHIPGYLNELLVQVGEDQKFGEVLNDSLECLFPQAFSRTLDVTQGQAGWQVKLTMSCYLSQQWGQSALMGAHKAALRAFWEGIGPDQERSTVLNLKKLSQQAESTGKWTGVLGTNTPTWSKGQEFLDSWPENLLP